MVDSDITVSGLSASGGIAQTVLTWDTPYDPHSPGGLPYLQLAAIEIWASQADDFGTAAKIGETVGANMYVHSGVSRGAIWYYWIRPRNNSDLYGDIHPSGGGVVGIEASNLLPGDTGHFTTANGMIEQWGIVIGAETLPIDLDGDGHRILTFPMAFPTKCVWFGVVGWAVPIPEEHPLAFNVRDITQTTASFSAFVLLPWGGFARVTEIEYWGTRISWRALGY